MPIVATQAGGIPAVVVNGQTDLTAPVGDVESLAKHCIRLLQDAELRHRIIEGGQNHLHTFTKQTMPKGVLGVYNKILALPV